MNKILTIISILIFLAGCASYCSAVKEDCRLSKVLYTDLTKKPNKRIYTLPNGKECKGVMR